MKKYYFLVFLIFYIVLQNVCMADPLSGSVEEENFLEQKKTGTIIDSATREPISNAQVSIPSKGIFVETDSGGRFSLNTSFKGPAILSVNADGYKPFSLTISDENKNKPLNIGVTKESSSEIVIDSKIHHLGDDSFAVESANAGDFRLNAEGHSFTKRFYVDNIDKGKTVALKIGSVIGLDTAIARKLRQNKITTSVSSPTMIYINSQKIGELRINGDGQQIFFPVQILNAGTYNEIIVKTGRNLSKANLDYDDMEFINLILEFK